MHKKGKNRVVTPAFFKPIAETECINCGQCAAVCLVGALTVKKNILEIQKNLDDPTKTCVVHMAPAVRVGIGEEFDLSANEETTGKMVAYSRKLGFKKVYDTVCSADLTIAFPSIIETYKKILPEGPCGEKAHHLLHTKYAKRGNFRGQR